MNDKFLKILIFNFLIKNIDLILDEKYLDLREIKFINNYNKIKLTPETAFIKNFNNKFIIGYIHAFEKHFKFIAHKRSPPVKIKRKSIKNELKFSYFIGTLFKNKNTKVIGYLHKNAFLGYIITSDDVYHLELDRRSIEHRIVIYTESSSKFYHPSSVNNIGKQRSKRDNNARNERRSNLRTERLPPKAIFAIYGRPQVPIVNQVCEITVIADYTIFRFYADNVAVLYGEIVALIEKVNHHFEMSDFDFDDEPDFIGVRIGNIDILDTFEASSFIAEDGGSIDDALNHCLLHWHSQIPTCLTFCYVGVDFSANASDHFGLTFQTKLEQDLFGGICTPYRRQFEMIDNVRTESIGYFNTGVVTEMYKEYVLSRAFRATTFIHEIGHSFGATHDNSSEIDDLILNGNVMRDYPKYTPTSLKNLYFSELSRHEINETLHRQAACFIPMPEAECGNGVIEQNEECDCGVEEICEYVDPCCVPNECIHKDFYLCDAGDACCTPDCLYIENGTTDCSSECFDTVYCSGSSSDCPNSMPLPLGTWCRWCVANSIAPVKNQCACDGNGNCAPITDLPEMSIVESFVQ